MSIDAAAARQTALDYIKAHEPSVGCELVLLDESTMEKPFGWVFFYNAKRYIESGELRDCLVGQGPLIVTRIDGRVHPTGSAYPVEHYLKAFKRYSPPPD